MAQSASYTIDYIPFPTVTEALLLNRPTAASVETFFDALDDLLGLLHVAPPDSMAERAACVRARHDMFVDKTVTRVEQLRGRVPGALFSGPTVNGRRLAGLDDVVAALAGTLRPRLVFTDRPFTVIHGDLFGGNMFFDEARSRLIVIDPRGSFGVPGSLGDPLYDLAKLSHGFHGGYDAIVADQFVCTPVNDTAFNLVTETAGGELLAQRFASWLGGTVARYAVTVDDVRAVEALLFVSLAALHSEAPSRQLAFVLRGLEIFTGVHDG